MAATATGASMASAADARALKTKASLLAWAKLESRTGEELAAACGRHVEVDRVIASHRSASAALLSNLSHSADRATRARVAANAATPATDIVRLGQQFPNEFIANPALDLLLLENPALMEQVTESFLVRLLKQADCPACLLTWASAHAQAKVQLAVAMNAGAPGAAIERLRQSSYGAVVQAVQARGGTAPEQDPERAFEQAVRGRLGSLAYPELNEAWASGDIGLAQWSALPLTFRLAKATQSDSFTPTGIARLLQGTSWSLATLQQRLPCYQRWGEVADDPNTPVPVLAALSEDRGSDVRSGVARSLFAPLAVLENLSKDPDKWVRSAVARNTATPASSLETLAKDSDDDVRCGVASNPAAPMHLLNSLARDPMESVRIGAAENASTPESLLETLAKKATGGIRSVLAGNPRTPSHVRVPLLERFAKTTDAWGRRQIVRSPAMPASLMEAFSKDPDDEVRSVAAGNPAMPVSLLEALAKDPEDGVRSAVAGNPTTPVPVLEALAGDSSGWVRRTVGSNTAAPASKLECLSNDPEEWVRSAVAKNTATPATVLDVLSGDSSHDVRAEVAKNSTTPPPILGRLLADKDSAVKTCAAGNPNAPVPALLKLLPAKTLRMSRALAAHVHRSPEIRKALWSDANDEVRRAVAGCPGLTQEVLEELVEETDLEGDLAALLEHPNLGAKSAELIADKLFNKPATASAWYRRELGKAITEVQAAAKADAVLSYCGKDPNKAVLAKRALAPLMALCAGPFIEPTRLIKVVGSTDWLVRAAVARNPGTPPNLLKKLVADTHPVVAAIARSRIPDESVEPSPSGPRSLEVPHLGMGRAIGELKQRLLTVSVEKPLLLINVVADPAWGEQATVDEVMTGLSHLFDLTEFLPKVLAKMTSVQRSLARELGAVALDPQVRRTLALDPECPMEAIRRLAHDDDLGVTLAAVANPVLPVGERKAVVQDLLKLRGSKLEKLVSRPDAPVELLQSNAKSDNRFVRREIARSGAAPVDLLEALANDVDDWVRASVAENPVAPVHLLVRLSEDRDESVRSAVAAHPSTPVSVLDALAKKATGDVKSALAGNPRTSMQFRVPLLKARAKSRKVWDRKSVADDVDAPASVLEVLSKDSDGWVRHGVATNHVTASAVLASMSKDKDEDVRKAVATNPSTPTSVLDTLARDGSPKVRRAVAGNPFTPAPMLTAMFKDMDEQVREEVAKNPSTPIEMLETLARDSSLKVRQAVAGNTGAAATTLASLSKDSELSVRSAVGRNQSTPAQVLLSLAADASYWVSRAVALNPSAPAEAHDRATQPWVTRIQRAVEREICIREGHAQTLQVSILPSDLLRAAVWLGLLEVNIDNKALTKASRSKDWLTRLSAALHPQVTDGILQLLAKDADADVSAAAMMSRSSRSAMGC